MVIAKRLLPSGVYKENHQGLQGGNSLVKGASFPVVDTKTPSILTDRIPQEADFEFSIHSDCLIRGSFLYGMVAPTFNPRTQEVEAGASASL